MNRFHAWSVAACVLFAMPMSAQGGPAWSLTARPVTSIGSTDGNLDQEVDAVLDARRLPDGRVLVVNGKPLELRVYSATGALITRIGRRGNGPGEYRGGVTLGFVGNDSVVVYSPGNSRWSVFGTDGRLRREWSVPYGDRPKTVFYRHAVVEPAGTAMTVCTRQMLDAMPLPDVPVIREVMADGAGRSWTHALGANAPWALADRTGRTLGTLTLPAVMTPMTMGPDYLVAIVRDEDDVEHVVVHRLVAPHRDASHVSADCNRPASAPLPGIPDDRARDIKATMRNTETAMEAYYSDHRSYATEAGALHVDPPGDVKLHILRSGEHGYWIGLFDVRSSYSCVVAVGDPVPSGWGDGEMHCGN